MLPPPPPALSDMRAGTALVAGLGTSTIIADIDFETYSEAGYVWNDESQRWDGLPGAPGTTKGLPLTGAEPYAAHPTASVIWMSYDLKDGLGRRRWRPGLPAPIDLFLHVMGGGLLEGWNVAFERWIWLHVLHARLGWPEVHDRQWRCAMAKARAFGLPGRLGEAGAVLNVPVQKDKRGAQLMKLFSMPRNPTKGDPRRRILPRYEHHGHPPGARVGEMRAIDEEFADTHAYGDYNETDIESEAQISAVVPDLTGAELAWWQCHEGINQRGVHIDRAALEDCISVFEQASARYNGELRDITTIESASKTIQLIAWLRDRGQVAESLDEEHVTEALKNPLLPPDVRRVYEIRAAVASASVKKLYAIRNRLSADSRLRDLYVYHGARTGRSTGEGPQPTNLPKAGPDTVRCACGAHYGLHRENCPVCLTPRPADARTREWNPEIAEQALEVLRDRSLEATERRFGDAMLTIAGVLRALFCAAPGHELISTDYNSIEAVGLAMLSGEQWRKDVFNTHGKIYEASASTMFSVPFEEFERHKKETGQHHPLRQKGKVGELGFGYQGWLGAAKAFGMPGTDDEIKADILAWRAASPAVEWLWGGQNGRKARDIIANARRDGYAGTVGACWEATPKDMLFGVEGAAVAAMQTPGWHVVLRLDGQPSGIEFRRHNNVLYCRLPSGRLLAYHRPALFESDRGGWGLTFQGWNSNPKNGPMGWITMTTWGGRLVENINQATCRDILAPACIALEEHGYPVVLHIYDEIVAEVPEGFGDIEEFERIVTVRPAWAHDWPIRAPGGYRAKRYRKG